MQSVKTVIVVFVAVLLCLSNGLTIRKNAANAKSDLINNVKNLSKKSVESLYSFEHDSTRGDGYEYYVPYKNVEKQPHPVFGGDEEEVNQYLYSQLDHKPKLGNAIVAPSSLLHQQQLLQKQQQEEQENALRTALSTNPLLAALFLSNSLGLPPAAASTRSFNHSAHLPVNPYVALLLSHYGRYIHPPIGRQQRGIYGYAAANNYHNNKPFGSYKIYEDAKK